MRRPELPKGPYINAEGKGYTVDLIHRKPSFSRNDKENMPKVKRRVDRFTMEERIVSFEIIVKDNI